MFFLDRLFDRGLAAAMPRWQSGGPRNPRKRNRMRKHEARGSHDTRGQRVIADSSDAKGLASPKAAKQDTDESETEQTITATSDYFGGFSQSAYSSMHLDRNVLELIEEMTDAQVSELAKLSHAEQRKKLGVEVKEPKGEREKPIPHRNTKRFEAFDLLSLQHWTRW